MRKLIIGFGILLVLFLLSSDNVFAVGIKGVTQESVPAKVTVITGCQNNGTYSRSRSIRNWLKKCEIRQKTRLRSTRNRRSRIIQREKPRFRSSRSDIYKKSTYTPVLNRKRTTTRRSHRNTYNYKRWINYMVEKRRKAKLLNNSTVK